MSSQTTYLHLVKPAYNETADIAVINSNMDTIDAAIKDMWQRMYPVGAIYMSVDSTSPATLFGGTWARLKDRFLLGAGDTYSAASTGGAASRSYTPAGTVGGTTLTVNQIPSHDHSFTGSVVNTGEQSQSHEHSMNGHTHTVSGHSHTIFNKHVGVAPGSMTIGVLGTQNDYTVYSYTNEGGSGNTGGPSTANTSVASANHVHGVTANGTIGLKGGGQSHNHGFTGTAATIQTMPPYLAVYMWKRTA